APEWKQRRPSRKSLWVQSSDMPFRPAFIVALRKSRGFRHALAQHFPGVSSANLPLPDYGRVARHQSRISNCTVQLHYTFGVSCLGGQDGCFVSETGHLTLRV